MTTDQLLLAAAVMMAVTAIAIGLARRLNLGSIAALLAVGIVLGPESPLPLLASHVGDLRAMGEIGVMLLLFLVGLDTQPSSLWSMRRLVFGFGSIEYGAASVAIAVFLLVFAHLSWQSALVIGLGLAMSSSAIPLPILEARDEAMSAHGRVTVAADILQSLMVIPVLALIPLLGAQSAFGSGGLKAPKLAEVLAVLAAVVALGRIVVPYWLAVTARSIGTGAFPLVVLASVFASGWMMHQSGIAEALGAFMMGVLLSTSTYAPQVKAAVTPARHVLLGVFFVAMGMAIDLKEVALFRGEVLFYVTVVLGIKVIVGYVVARAFHVDRKASLLSALLLMPLDEIAFVVFASARQYGLLNAHAHTLALLAISLSFIVSPIAINIGFRIASWRRRAPGPASPDPQHPESVAGRVVVVGLGTVGAATGALLAATGIDFVCFDSDPRRVEGARRRGWLVGSDDVTDLAFARAARLTRATAIVVTLEDYEAVKRVLTSARDSAPSVPVIAAVDFVSQRDELARLDIGDSVALVPEGLAAFGRAVLGLLAIQPARVQSVIDDQKARDFGAYRGPAGASQPDGSSRMVSIASPRVVETDVGL